MSDAASLDGRPPQPRRRFNPTTGSKWLGFAIVVTLALVSAVVFWWRPWVPASCRDDGAHVIDDESGVCYSIPEGWQERDATAEEDPLTSVIASGQALIAAGPLEDVPTARDAAKRARFLLLGLLGTGPQVFALYEKSGTVEGHASATASDTARGTWAMVTVIEMEGGMVGLVSSAPNTRLT